jgi:hypothetical protein
VTDRAPTAPSHLRRNDPGAQLLQRSKEIRPTPPSEDLARGQTHDVEGGDLDRLVGGREAEEGAVVGAAPGYRPSHQVSLGEDGFDGATEVVER